MAIAFVTVSHVYVTKMLDANMFEILNSNIKKHEKKNKNTKKRKVIVTSMM